jgi:hypothetical protein
VDRRKQSSGEGKGGWGAVGSHAKHKQMLKGKQQQQQQVSKYNIHTWRIHTPIHTYLHVHSPYTSQNT